MIKANAIYLGIYTSVFGPEPKKSCEDYVSKSCGRDSWPWLPSPGAPPPHDHVLGQAIYGAVRVGSIITLMAAGILRRQSDSALLIQLPILIWPPEFQLVIEGGSVGSPALRPFGVTTSIPDPQKQVTKLNVHDEDGVHLVIVR